MVCVDSYGSAYGARDAGHGIEQTYLMSVISADHGEKVVPPTGPADEIRVRRPEMPGSGRKERFRYYDVALVFAPTEPQMWSSVKMLFRWMVLDYPCRASPLTA